MNKKYHMRDNIHFDTYQNDAMYNKCGAPAERAIDSKGVYPFNHRRCSYLCKKASLSMSMTWNVETVKGNDGEANSDNTYIGTTEGQ